MIIYWASVWTRVKVIPKLITTACNSQIANPLNIHNCFIFFYFFILFSVVIFFVFPSVVLINLYLSKPKTPPRHMMRMCCLFSSIAGVSQQNSSYHNSMQKHLNFIIITI